MKRLTLLLPPHLLLATVSLILLPMGCASGEGSTGTGQPNEIMQLEVTFVSGHLGTSGFCGDEETPVAHSAQSSSEDPSGVSRAPCPADDEDCPGLTMHCENGELTLQFRNLGATTLTGLDVSDLELLEANQDFVKGLDVDSISRVNGQPFDGTLEPGGVIQLRIDFSSGHQGVSGKDRRVRIIVADEFGQTTEITTPSIQTITTIAT
jgi:hypothetical protein